MEIVDDIHLPTSLDALGFREPRRAETDTLMPMVPTCLLGHAVSDFSQVDVLVLVSDLSNVTTPLQATRRFVAWREDIQENPELWRNGWNLDIAPLIIAEWADEWGSSVVLLFLMKQGRLARCTQFS